MKIPVGIALTLLAIGLGACTPMGPRDDRGAGGAGRDCDFAPTVIDEVQTQLGDTARELGLSSRQLVLWERYHESVNALIADLVRIEPYRPPDQTALQQIDANVDTVRNRLAVMDALAEAAGQLYQSLDEAQKKVADRRLPLTVPTLYSGSTGRSCGPDRSFPPPRGREGRGARGSTGGSPGGSMGRF